MLRIGMIGADNFHALAFSRLANLPPEEGGSGLPARVTMLWGESAQRAAFVANEAHIHTGPGGRRDGGAAPRRAAP